MTIAELELKLKRKIDRERSRIRKADDQLSSIENQFEMKRYRAVKDVATQRLYIYQDLVEDITSVKKELDLIV